jgi:hypothetical protein
VSSPLFDVTGSPKSGGGITCQFFRVGLKTFRTEGECRDSRESQLYAHGHGIGPAVLSEAFPVQRAERQGAYGPDKTVVAWGYCTELAELIEGAPERGSPLREQHKLLQRLTEAVWGCEHSDPHWGNVGLVERDGEKQLVWIDFEPGLPTPRHLRESGKYVTPGLYVKPKRPEKPERPRRGGLDDCNCPGCETERRHHAMRLAEYQERMAEFNRQLAEYERKQADYDAAMAALDGKQQSQPEKPAAAGGFKIGAIFDELWRRDVARLFEQQQKAMREALMRDVFGGALALPKLNAAPPAQGLQEPQAPMRSPK